MEDAALYNEVRKSLLAGFSHSEIRESFGRKGYTDSQIYAALQDVYKDNLTDADEKLIAIVEKRFRSGHQLTEIIETLQKEGYSTYDVQKALLRAELDPSSSIGSTFKSWSIYSYMQLVGFIATILLALFYNYLFFIPAVITVIMLAASSMHMRDVSWETKISVQPFIGLTVSQGAWGYNSTIGNYTRWWTFEPHTVIAAAFLFISVIGVTRNTLMLSYIAGCLALLSFISWWSLSDLAKDQLELYTKDDEEQDADNK